MGILELKLLLRPLTLKNIIKSAKIKDKKKERAYKQIL